jgi:alpha-L-arabinofuranosidase
VIAPIMTEPDGPAWRHIPIELTVDTSRTPVTAVPEALSMHDDDRFAVNSAQHPDRVTPTPNDSVRVEAGRVTVTLPSISWTALSLPPADTGVRLGGRGHPV